MFSSKLYFGNVHALVMTLLPTCHKNNHNPPLHNRNGIRHNKEDTYDYPILPSFFLLKFGTQGRDLNLHVKPVILDLQERFERSLMGPEPTLLPIKVLENLELHPTIR